MNLRNVIGVDLKELNCLVHMVIFLEVDIWWEVCDRKIQKSCFYAGAQQGFTTGAVADISFFISKFPDR